MTEIEPTLSRAEIGPKAGQLEPATFRRLLAEHGVVLMRHAAASSDEFVEISDRFCSRWLPYKNGGREIVSLEKQLQTANLQPTPVPPHGEYSYLPIHPEMIFLYCERAPASGGATTLYDGVAIADGLPTELRRAIQGRQFRYRSRVALESAIGAFGASDRDDFERLIDERGWGDALRLTDHELHQDWLAPILAIHPRSGSEVFVNMLVHNAAYTPGYARVANWLTGGHFRVRPYPRPDDPKTLESRVRGRLQRLIRTRHGRGVALYPTFEDGSLIPQRLVQTLDDEVRRHEIAVTWQQGDVLAIDNHRFMHGRQALGDPSRRILTRIGGAQ